MNGPEHYRAAERLADDADRHAQGDPADQAYAAVTATRALVHAQLAAAAAAIDARTIDRNAWLPVLNPPAAAEQSEQLEACSAAVETTLIHERTRTWKCGDDIDHWHPSTATIVPPSVAAAAGVER